VICLLSGGGSALLTDYPDGSSLDELMKFSKMLVNSGASINEINAVRKHLSSVKGGQLARITHPARMLSLMLSDVVGDPLDVIASGPTVADTSTFGDAVNVLVKYGIDRTAPANLLQLLKNGYSGKRPETPKPADPMLDRTANLVIGSNKLALESGLRFARTQGLDGEIITDRLEGNTEEIAGMIISRAVDFQKSRGLHKPYCLLFGGETTLKVTGNGLGGRNQHLALKAAFLLKDLAGVTLLAGGTDGTDGPNDMAGAVVDCNTWRNAMDAGIDGNKYLADFDSFHFFQQAGGHVFTGPTMTNVMDVTVVVID